MIAMIPLLTPPTPDKTTHTTHLLQCCCSTDLLSQSWVQLKGKALEFFSPSMFLLSSRVMNFESKGQGPGHKQREEFSRLEVREHPMSLPHVSLGKVFQACPNLLSYFPSCLSPFVWSTTRFDRKLWFEIPNVPKTNKTYRKGFKPNQTA